MTPEEREQYIKEAWGETFIDDYVGYCFEFACKEADFIGIDQKGDDFEMLCTLRRNALMAGMYERTRNLSAKREISHKNLKDYVHVTVSPIDTIDTVIRGMYLG